MYAASGPGTGAMTACGARKGWHICRFHACPVNKMTSKARAGTRRACARRWQRRDRHDPPEREDHKFPVPQGERGILWAWPGQPSHLPPPAVGIMGAYGAVSGLDIPMPGVSSRVVPPPENTAQYFNHLFLFYRQWDKWTRLLGTAVSCVY